MRIVFRQIFCVSDDALCACWQPQMKRFALSAHVLVRIRRAAHFTLVYLAFNHVRSSFNRVSSHNS